MLFKLKRDFKESGEEAPIYIETKAIVALTTSLNNHTNVFLTTGESFASIESVAEFVSRMRDSGKHANDMKPFMDSLFQMRSKAHLLKDAMERIRECCDDSFRPNQLQFVGDVARQALAEVSLIE
jgi:hypothetical protein